MPGKWFGESTFRKCGACVYDFEDNWDLPLDFDETKAVVGLYAFRRTFGVLI